MDKLDHATGDSDLKALAEDALRKGATSGVTDDGNTLYQIFAKYMDVNTAQFVVTKGGDVTDFPLFIEVGNKEDIVPEAMIGGGVSWEEWLRPNHSFIERDDRLFVGSDAHTGYPLNVSELQPVFGKLFKGSDLPIVEDV